MVVVATAAAAMAVETVVRGGRAVAVTAEEEKVGEKVVEMEGGTE